MSSFLNDIEQNSPDAVRRLSSTQEPPDTAAIPATVIAQPAAAEDDDDPRTPLPDQREIIEDRRRLGDLEQEVHKYRCLLDEVNLHMAAQQAAHDDALCRKPMAFFKTGLESPLTHRIFTCLGVKLDEKKRILTPKNYQP